MLRLLEEVTETVVCGDIWVHHGHGMLVTHVDNIIYQDAGAAEAANVHECLYVVF